MERSHWKRTLLVVGLFAVAMAFLESAVVVYLRSLYYPEGFSFPLKIMPANILMVEVIREAATIVMLAAVAWIAGGSVLGRFAFFAFAFSVWDIFYYVFLRLILNWPTSLLDWDILFLIPLPWIAPVLAPVIVSACLIIASTIVLKRESAGMPVKFSVVQWLFLILGGMVVISSFMVNTQGTAQQSSFPPFNWYLFATGMFLALSMFASSLRK
jgi:hypothetical protein